MEKYVCIYVCVMYPVVKAEDGWGLGRKRLYPFWNGLM